MYYFISCACKKSVVRKIPFPPQLCSNAVINNELNETEQNTITAHAVGFCELPFIKINNNKEVINVWKIVKTFKQK